MEPATLFLTIRAWLRFNLIRWFLMLRSLPYKPYFQVEVSVLDW